MVTLTLSRGKELGSKTVFISAGHFKTNFLICRLKQNKVITLNDAKNKNLQCKRKETVTRSKKANINIVILKTEFSKLLLLVA